MDKAFMARAIELSAQMSARELADLSARLS